MADSGQERAIAVQTRRFDLEYEVNPEALPLSRVELWYSRDEGRTWHNFGLDDDTQSPVRFDAAEEGLYGFYFVVSNEMGDSTDPPQPGTEPQHWAYVDFTPPVLQVHPVTLEGGGVEPIARVRWTALDGHLSARPIELQYRQPPGEEWQRLAGPIANSGSYDWRLPPELEGRTSVRVSVVDRGGHQVSAEVSFDTPALTVGSVPSGPRAGRSPTTQPTAAERARAEKIFQRGVAHKEHGEYRLAASRFRDALAIAPYLTEALVNLGDALYFQHQHAEAIEAYRLALDQEPGWLRARRGLAKALIGARKHPEAASELTRILDAAPDDAQAWLDQGDVAMWRGDEALARDSWRRAETVEGRPEEIAERARTRLMDIDHLAPWRISLDSRKAELRPQP